MSDFVRNLLNYLTELGSGIVMKVLLGLVIIFVGMKLCKWLAKKLEKMPGFKKLDPGVKSFSLSALKIVLYIILFSSVAFLWGVPTTAFVTLFTSVGVAVGLALQGSLANFAGGLLLLIFKPFKIGDYIECNGISGTVRSITVIYTTLITPDAKEITIPNGGLTNSNIINYSSQKKRRVDLTISAGYETDVEKVKEVLLKVANEHDKIIKDPVPEARLIKHGADALEYAFRVWCKNEDYWTVYFDCQENIRKAFAANNINIPYKQVDVHNV